MDAARFFIYAFGALALTWFALMLLKSVWLPALGIAAVLLLFWRLVPRR
ncbi:hypothetical protein KBB96_10305 [Luteolibacter ambystomatis]|uniref:Uncharacterized protein n=1 Tax=Luteolibacter ambystomatis TaxID=2824561 RepID=A0A975G5L1_9BACT|nr:hypothetical protein [Luteolibacter ambystomatis]QUE49265.1 hypothetical protein KBB96_10305 [Luteolibacter ambystomatis]